MSTRTPRRDRLHRGRAGGVSDTPGPRPPQPATRHDRLQLVMQSMRVMSLMFCSVQMLPCWMNHSLMNTRIVDSCGPSQSSLPASDRPSVSIHPSPHPSDCPSTHPPGRATVRPTVRPSPSVRLRPTSVRPTVWPTVPPTGRPTVRLRPSHRPSHRPSYGSSVGRSSLQGFGKNTGNHGCLRSSI